MLFNWVKNAGAFLCSPSGRTRRSLMLAAVAFLFGPAVVSAAVPVLTFAQLVTCPLDAAALRADSAAAAGFPEKIRSVIGQRVQITGYMLPLVVENGRASRLLLMRNTMACCYGQSPAANEYLVIKTPPPGLPVTMDVPVALQGTLRIEPVMLGGLVVEYFHLDQAALASL